MTRWAARGYLGEADGQPAATAVSMTLGAYTGIFNVTTLPGFRRRGFGTAITARAAADRLAVGASYCWLQSSPDGYPVYRNLGFRTIETWPCWIAGSSR
jgi:N-acetylglutamate synthase